MKTSQDLIIPVFEKYSKLLLVPCKLFIYSLYTLVSKLTSNVHLWKTNAWNFTLSLVIIIRWAGDLIPQGPVLFLTSPLDLLWWMWSASSSKVHVNSLTQHTSPYSFCKCTSVQMMMAKSRAFSVVLFYSFSPRLTPQPMSLLLWEANHTQSESPRSKRKRARPLRIYVQWWQRNNAFAVCMLIGWNGYKLESAGSKSGISTVQQSPQ